MTWRHEPTSQGLLRAYKLGPGELSSYGLVVLGALALHRRALTTCSEEVPSPPVPAPAHDCALFLLGILSTGFRLENLLLGDAGDRQLTRTNPTTPRKRPDATISIDFFR
jgi:hypothetical protein